MINRDQYGIIIQMPLDINSPDDSLARTSLLVLGKNEFDKSVIQLWYPMQGEPARHPYTAPANKYGYDEVYKYDKCLSRDQLVPYVSALLAIGTDEARQVAEAIRQRHGMFVNQDILMPDIKYIMAKAAGHWSQYLWAIPGIPLTVLSILFTCIFTPNHELNQLFAQTKAIGKWATKLVTILHRDWKRNLQDYWGTFPDSHGFWRGLPEMAQLLIESIEGDIS